MTQASEEPRTRRNSDAGSQYSFSSQYTQFSWKHMIQPQPKYGEDGLTTYLGDEDGTIGRLLQPSESHMAQPTEQPERFVRNREQCHFSPVPALTASGNSSSGSSSLRSLAPNQMYGLYHSSDGILQTNRAAGPVVINTGIQGDGVYRCLFALSTGCPERHPEGTWIEHVGSHLGDIEPPKSCLCSVCGEVFDTGTPAITWFRFLDHVLRHKYSGYFPLDQGFLEFCRENDIISDFTMERLAPDLQAQRMSQEPPFYRNQTPRVLVGDTRRGNASIARVDYPARWEADPHANERDIWVNRGHLSGRGANR